MNRTSVVKLAVLLTAFSAVGTAQTDAQEMPTNESIARLVDQSDGYVRLVAQALAWKAPVTQECANTRARIETIAQRTLGRDQLAKPVPAQLLLETYQRTEDNVLARLATFSRTVYEAILQSCLAIPARKVPRTP